MEPLRYQVDPTPGETARAVAAIAHASLPDSRSYLIIWSIYLLVGIAAFVFARETLVTTFVIGFIAVSVTPFLLQAETRARFRKVREKDVHALETHFVELSGEGVRSFCSHADARYPWQDFTKVIKTSEFYLFVQPAGRGSSIPVRVLDDAAESRLLTSIREWVPAMPITRE